MEKQAFYRLIDRYLRGEATSGEQLLVEEYYKRLEKGGKTELTREQASLLKGVMLKNIRKRIKRPVFKGINWVRVAAAVLVLVVAGLYFFKSWQAPQQARHTAQQNDVEPGGNRAVLTLADGKQVVLEEAEEGAIVLQGGARADKSRNDQLVYTRDLRETGETAPLAAQHTLRTPRGGQYQLSLADGTRVWLNAASSITYPATFSGKERRVSITGEAYFEVAEDLERPFKVRLPDETEIEVLGTHFNIMAYEDEETSQTTLLKGGIKVSRTPRVLETESPKLLYPGQQARISKGGDAIRVLEVDPEEAVAWKNELFLFSGTDIEVIMRRVARWYDVEVVYEGDPSGSTFTGQISRYSNVSKVLQMLEFTGGAQFNIDGRRITVMP